MATKLKEIVDKSETFDKLDIRLGEVLSVVEEPSALKKSYKICVNFGKFGKKVTVARLTEHSPEDLIGQQVIGVLNFSARQVGNISSEFLILGVQFPKAESGSATVMTPLQKAKLGSKLI